MKPPHTVTASDFRKNLRETLERVHGSRAVRILHRGEPVRLLVTEEHYFALLQRINKLEQGMTQHNGGYQK